MNEPTPHTMTPRRGLLAVHRRWQRLASGAAAILWFIVFLGPTSKDKAFGNSGISDLAYPLLTERVTANQTSFFVYQDADSGFNHGFPSGFFGVTNKIHLDPACVDEPSTPNGCSTDPNRLDRQRGTVLRVSFDPLLPGEYAGLNIEEPERWGERRVGVGYDLRGATQVTFDVRSPDGITVQFGVGGCTTSFVTIPLSPSYAEMSIPLSSLSCLPNLVDVHILFAIATNDRHAPNGGTVLLDNIRFEPTPSRQQTDPKALSFPLSTQTFGTIPAQNPAPGRVPIPPDQVNRNITTIYESALSLLALLARGTTEDLRDARWIANTFAYALQHDNHGDPLPLAPDGSVGLHNAYASGDIALLNDQIPPAAGQADDIRLAGFSASMELCGPSAFCLVLDGATGGNNAFAILALAAAYRQFGDAYFLDAARTIARWIVGNLTDNTGTGYGGYYLGYPDEGRPKELIKSKSVENNADIFAAFTALAAIEKQLGNDAQADEWTRRANVAGEFVMEMFDPTLGRFYAGTVLAGTPPGPGICPDGPQRGGNDVINTCDFLDANTFPTLALAGAPRYRTQIDWRRPVQFVLDRFAQRITVGGYEVRGFNIVQNPTAGPNGIAWEFTAQAVAVMRFVDRLYPECRFEADADFYLSQIHLAQQFAPFGDGRGLVASTLQDGHLLPPGDQCLSTPFQCIPERVGLAATTWAIFADQQVNPLSTAAAPLLGLLLCLNKTDFRRAEPLLLTARVAPDASARVVDAYVAVQLPDGGLLFLLGDGTISPVLQPIVRSWPISPFTGQIFTYTFTGGEPVGSYAWLAAFTEPGTLNFIGPIVSVPFSFNP